MAVGTVGSLLFWGLLSSPALLGVGLLGGLGAAGYYKWYRYVF